MHENADYDVGESSIWNYVHMLEIYHQWPCNLYVGSKYDAVVTGGLMVAPQI